MRAAVVETSTGKVINVVVLDDGANWFPPIGCHVEPANEKAESGGTWSKQGGFVRAPSPVKAVKYPTLEERVAALEAKVTTVQ